MEEMTIEELHAHIGGLITEQERLITALKSIAANTCCEPCQEAKLVAQAALDNPNE